MTYSIKVRGDTRDECKRRFVHALTMQTSGQPTHQHDRPHIERVICALIDLQDPDGLHDIVVDVYGYVSAAADGRPLLIAANIKVYSAMKEGSGVIPVLQPPPAGTY